MALDTVQDYLDRARALLLDTVQPYRYSNVDLIEALNLAILEARRIRPELFSKQFRSSLPDFNAGGLNAQVDIDPMVRSAFLYYMAGHAQLRDDENNQDGRAALFLNKFTSQLLNIAA